MKVSVSILSSCDDKELTTKQLIKKYNDTDVDYIHLDIMDGKFVPKKSFSFSEIKTATSGINKKLDVHLMVSNPKKYIDDYALLNTEYITFHYETVKNISEMIDYIKGFGLKVGISINPNTSVDVLFPYLKHLDLVLIMSVEPGSSGQAFIIDSADKIKLLRNEIDKNNYKTIIEVDGGINGETSLLVKEAGAHIVVSDSFIRNDIIHNIEYLKTL